MGTTTSTTRSVGVMPSATSGSTRVLDDFSILKGGHFGYRIELTAWKPPRRPAFSINKSTDGRIFIGPATRRFHHPVRPRSIFALEKA